LTNIVSSVAVIARVNSLLTLFTVIRTSRAF
jgi:hypothetical protein